MWRYKRRVGLSQNFVEAGKKKKDLFIHRWSNSASKTDKKINLCAWIWADNVYLCGVMTFPSSCGLALSEWSLYSWGSSDWKRKEKPTEKTQTGIPPPHDRLSDRGHRSRLGAGGQQQLHAGAAGSAGERSIADPAPRGNPPPGTAPLRRLSLWISEDLGERCLKSLNPPNCVSNSDF